jgi:DMSO/TMAO reductase YedYZ molybdopterin-dependent catalytic subunit
MNDASLSFGHGAPLRLRNEIELGFKQVKWIKGIEFVATSPRSAAATAATTKTTSSSATANRSDQTATRSTNEQLGDQEPEPQTTRP